MTLPAIGCKTLKLIGAGYGRTGTLSLKLALEELGLTPCHHMAEVILHPESSADWSRAADGNGDWDKIYRNYAATVDFPGCTFWRELAAFYPDAKVLLSVRDPEKWFESTQATIFSRESIQRLESTPMKEFFDKVVWKVFDGRLRDRNFMIEAFNRHNAEVQRSIPKDRLLVYEVSQGWEPLCAFLGVPVPRTPFPKVNSREEMAALMADSGSAGPQGPPDLARMQEAVRARLKRPQS